MSPRHGNASACVRSPSLASVLCVFDTVLLSLIKLPQFHRALRGFLERRPVPAVRQHDDDTSRDALADTHLRQRAGANLEEAERTFATVPTFQSHRNCARYAALWDLLGKRTDEAG